MKWWQAHGVYAENRASCWYCDAVLVDERFVISHQGVFRGRHKIFAMQVCEPCERFEITMLEAQDECRKFTAILISERCSCGNAMLAALNECMQCARERRMLDKRWADIKYAMRVLKQVREEIRRVKTH